MKTMKSTMARLFVLCLTMAMVLSVATMGAFAAPITSTTQTGTVTIIGSANDAKAEVKLYQIINVNMDETALQPKDPMYTWVDAVATWLKGNEVYKSYINADTKAVTEEFAKADAKTLSDFYKALSTAIQGETVKLSAAAEGSLDEATYTMTSDLPMGQYLVIASKTGNTYNSATATLYPEWGTNSWELNDATVVLKSKGGIEKDVDNGDLGHAVGDTVTYRLDVAIPVYPEAGPNEVIYKTFKVGDTMGTGLDFDGIDTVKVYANTSPNTYAEGDLVPNDKNANYTVTAQGNGFEINFNYDALKAAVGTDTYVHVVYTGTLNEDAFTTDELGNTAYVEVNTNPYDENSHEKTTVEKKVYTYGINVTKVDAANPNTTLAGAEFTLKDSEGQAIQFAKTSDGVYVKYDAGNYTQEDGVTPVTTLVVASNGILQIQGVDVGTYTLTETKAPNGYQLPADPEITITLEDTTGGKPSGADGVLDGKTGATGSMLVGSTIVENDTNVISVKMKNEKPGFELPTTGGMGTVLFTAGGLVIMACGAALVLVTLKKKKAED